MNDTLQSIGFYSLSDDRAKNASEVSQMKRCEMIINEYCNFSCPYCRGLRNDIFGNRRIRHMSLEEIEMGIDLWCENIPLENIRFSGGEPTLHPNIKDAVKYAKQKGIKRVAISTNGSNKLELYKDLIKLGCDDYSISLDACCANIGDKMAGNIKGAFNKVVDNIRKISKLTYVTVGIVLTEDNVSSLVDTIKFADSLGVSDIRIISAAQFNRPLTELNKLEDVFLNKYPILKYRVNNFKNGINVRGITSLSDNKCAIVLDDSVIAGINHYPCVIYMREGGNPIGKIGPNMRLERKAWFKNHDCYADKICKNNCLDACVAYNAKYKKFHFT